MIIVILIVIMIIILIIIPQEDLVSKPVRTRIQIPSVQSIKYVREEENTTTMSFTLHTMIQFFN